MTRYRLKMPIVEARRVPVFTDDPSVEKASVVEYVEECISLATWCWGKSYMMHTGTEPGYYYPEDPGYDHVLITTSEGNTKILPGDWIIKDENGWFYSCKNETFRKIYEEVKS